MADKRKLVVEIIGDDDSLRRAFKGSEKAAQRFSVGVGTIAKSAVVFTAVQAGVEALAGSLRVGVDEWREQVKVSAQTNAIIAATGGVANVTAKQVDQLASSIQNYSGIDDEAIKSGANLILTFKNIRNELGRGNAIFDRATKAAVDLSQVGFGAITTLSKQVGKALQDPVRGLTALTRAGVTFTQKQKDQVKAFVESNRFIQAQKVILKEIESQVGGTARAIGETLPGQLAKVREAFRNAFGNLVGAVAQPLANALGAFSGFIPKIEQGVARISTAVGPGLDRLVGAFTDRLPQIQRVAGSVLDPFREHVVPILREVAQIVGNFWSNVVSIFDQRSGQIRQILANVGELLQNVWTVAKPTIVFLFEKALPAALNITIPVMEKVTGVAKTLSQVFVQVVSAIVKALDVLLGGFTKLADAASHLPFVGDQFKGVSDRVNEAREGLRGFAAELDALDGRKVSISLAVDVTTGRREEGALGRSGGDSVEKVTDDALAGLKKQSEGARRIQTAANTAATTTKSALTAAEKQRQVFDKLMDALGLRRDRAAETAGLKDDLRALAAQEKAIRAQVRIEGRTTELERRLFEIAQERKQIRQQMREQAAERRQTRQFALLGLGPGGEEAIPGVKQLRNQLGNISQAIKGTFLDTGKTRSLLQSIRKLLSGQLGALSDDVRAKIKELLDGVNDELRGGASSGPATKFVKRGVENLIAGLGLSPEQVKELRQRFSQIGPGGTAPKKGVSAFGFPVAGAVAGGFGPIIIQTTVELDGQVVGESVTRHQQKKRGRNATSRRGTRAGRM